MATVLQLLVCCLLQGWHLMLDLYLLSPLVVFVVLQVFSVVNAPGTHLCPLLPCLLQGKLTDLLAVDANRILLFLPLATRWLPIATDKPLPTTFACWFHDQKQRFAQGMSRPLRSSSQTPDFTVCEWFLAISHNTTFFSQHAQVISQHKA